MPKQMRSFFSKINNTHTLILTEMREFFKHFYYTFELRKGGANEPSKLH
jgi:hypothetical protein